ncbi:hypothetical protein [Hamadaea tsunoensis]|uniref:hypothetical protein n=1 Tax=Hamadaea tsunoensis TaxID=53368 RepID=UPI00040FC52B|nr:hypothetical protein [Hamadaea tsunoensis]
MFKTRRFLTLAVAVAGLVAATGTPALASYDDSFATHTVTPSDCSDKSDPAGYIYFVDYGEGDLSNPAKNDDYITLRDTCANGNGVRGYAFLNGTSLGSVYNGKGNGSFVVWDPFGNVKAGDKVGIAICSVNGSGGSPYDCSSVFVFASVDG